LESTPAQTLMALHFSMHAPYMHRLCVMTV